MEITTSTTTESIAFAHPKARVLFHTKQGVREGNARITIAYRTNGLVCDYAVAFCAPHDNFSKKIGRAIAEGRLQKEGSYRTINLVTKDEIIKTIIGNILQSALPHNWLTASI